MLGVQPMIFDAFDQSGFGLSLSAGFWLDGEAFSGFVVRPMVQFNSMHYTTDYTGGLGQDESKDITHTEVRLGGLLGSHARWNYFTIAGGFGLLIDANATETNKTLRVDTGTAYKVHGFGQRLSPKVDIISRISLGVVF